MIIEKYGRCPCDDSWISQGYKSSHKAIDLGWLTKYGENRPVKAWKSGTVVATGTDSAGGVYVVLQHDHEDARWISRYWHFVKGSVVVKKGQTVKQGDKLGIRGDTGISSGTHLHFELWKCPKGYSYKSSDYPKYAVNPINYTFLFEGQVMKSEPILPKKPVEKEKPKPVERNEKLHQVKVIADQLRIRETPSLNGEQLFICDKGVYNVIQSKVADGYTWLEIEKDRWIATKEGEWTIDFPKAQEPTQEEIIIDLKVQIETLTKESSLLKEHLISTESALKEANRKINEVRKVVA